MPREVDRDDGEQAELTALDRVVPRAVDGDAAGVDRVDEGEAVTHAELLGGVHAAAVDVGDELQGAADEQDALDEEPLLVALDDRLAVHGDVEPEGVVDDGALRRVTGLAAPGAAGHHRVAGLGGAGAGAGAGVGLVVAAAVWLASVVESRVPVTGSGVSEAAPLVEVSTAPLLAAPPLTPKPGLGIEQPGRPRARAIKVEPRMHRQ
jgi:hypothetical protein